MKIGTILLPLGVLAALLGGCNSSANQSAASPEQRTAQTIGDKSIPAPAQNLASQQDQQKRQMDAMRAADAKTAR